MRLSHFILAGVCIPVGVASVVWHEGPSKAISPGSEVPGLPNCGGNAQGTGVNPTVPWTCGNAKTIPGIVGGPVIGRLTLSQGPNNNGQVTVEVTLPGPQDHDVSLEGKWHKQKSSNPPTAFANGVIPAGQVTMTVSTGLTNVCDGQFDFKVNGNAPDNRLHGPWLTITTCQLIPPVTVTTTPTSTPSTTPTPTITPSSQLPPTE